MRGRTATIELSLDGYTDLPPGKIANVVTYLARAASAAPPGVADRPDLALRRLAGPDPDAYRDLYRRVGESWLWFSRAGLGDAALTALLAEPGREVHVLEREGVPIGYSELDRSKAGEVEIVFFGVVPEAIGTGAAAWMMGETLRRAALPGVERIWVHTCTFDHPAAVRFYRRCGFEAWKFAIEVTDDPRLDGRLPEDVAPHVPFIRPSRTRPA